MHVHRQSDKKNLSTRMSGREHQSSVTWQTEMFMDRQTSKETNADRQLMSIHKHICPIRVMSVH